MGYIYLYTGDGAGKTTNALGLALRSLGHGHNVLIIQFLKWYWLTGENLFQYLNLDMPSKYTLMQFGRQGWHGLDNLTDRDKELARKGLEVFKATINSTNPYNLIILDELNLAMSCGLLTDKEVLDALEFIPKETNIVITGRNAPKSLLDRSDFINVITCTKMPTELVSEEGIQY